MRRGNLDIIAENFIEFNFKVFNPRSFLFALFKACYITVSAVCRKAEIINFFVENKTEMDVIKPVLDACKKNGFNNPNEIDDLEIAKEVVAMCK